jgi:hypothetical protein
MSLNQIMRIAVILIGIIIVIKFLLFLFGGSRDELSKSIAADHIVNIDVSTDIGDIQIAPHDGHDIRVQLEGKATKKPSKKFKLTLKEKNGEVIIKAKTRSGFLSFRKLSDGYTILVELPTKQYDRLLVHADVANIYVDSIYANESQTTTNVGNINLIGVGGVITAQSEVGDITISLQSIANNIQAKTEVGNIAVKTKEAPLALQTGISNSVGNKTINLPNEAGGSIGIGGPNVKLTVAVGNVSLSLSD